MLVKGVPGQFVFYLLTQLTWERFRSMREGIIIHINILIYLLGWGRSHVIWNASELTTTELYPSVHATMATNHDERAVYRIQPFVSRLRFIRMKYTCVVDETLAWGLNAGRYRYRADRFNSFASGRCVWMWFWRCDFQQQQQNNLVIDIVSISAEISIRCLEALIWQEINLGSG